MELHFAKCVRCGNMFVSGIAGFGRPDDPIIVGLNTGAISIGGNIFVHEGPVCGQCLGWPKYIRGAEVSEDVCHR